MSAAEADTTPPDASAEKQDEKSDKPCHPPTPDASGQVLIRIKFEHKIEQSLKQSEKEAHHKRIQSLRKELDYLNDTAWQFENGSPF